MALRDFWEMCEKVLEWLFVHVAVNAILLLVRLLWIVHNVLDFALASLLLIVFGCYLVLRDVFLELAAECALLCFRRALAL